MSVRYTPHIRVAAEALISSSDLWNKNNASLTKRYVKYLTKFPYYDFLALERFWFEPFQGE